LEDAFRHCTTALSEAFELRRAKAFGLHSLPRRVQMFVQLQTQDSGADVRLHDPKDIPVQAAERL
jgi:hypothetical protein